MVSAAAESGRFSLNVLHIDRIGDMRRSSADSYFQTELERGNFLLPLLPSVGTYIRIPGNRIGKVKQEAKMRT